MNASNAVVFGHISRICGSSVEVTVDNNSIVSKTTSSKEKIAFLTVGSLFGTRLLDKRILTLSVSEVREENKIIIVRATITGIFDESSNAFSFGTDSYPIINEPAFFLDGSILSVVFHKENCAPVSIGSYVFNKNVQVTYDPNILFGKHLGVFGNTGSGKTCTIVSIIQHYLKENPDKNIKFIILDVNSEYGSAFEKDGEYIPFDKIKIHHSHLNFPEYCDLFRAAQGVQLPALRDVIYNEQNSFGKKWKISELPKGIEDWISKNATDNFSKNTLFNNLRTLILRIESIISDPQLSNAVDSDPSDDIAKEIIHSDKPVQILDMSVSADTLDIILFLFFKTLFQDEIEERKKNQSSAQICLVLEEAHRYLKTENADTSLATNYIEKIAREGRKFGIGLIISSQIPSMLSYEIISQCNSVVMHKITNKRDMEFLRGVLRFNDDVFYSQMSSLEKQHALVCGEAFSSDALVKILDASPLPKSKDPQIPNKIPNPKHS